ncbi:putative nuclease HARBI1 [Saccostrea cucullata]|uniref:putative nuclease HARBI1 n=1 Tax=Saccostrea cuccullata TaxID=36930 RepID=UPI002ED0B09A
MFAEKNFHALNIQAVADARMRFLHINASFPGSTHDAFVLTNSGLPRRIQSLPEGGWLLGDSGYPLKNWILTPFPSPSNQQEEKFNEAHGRTRIVVERAFGVLKSRFRCLHKTGGSLPFSPLKCSRVIETCFRLHNVAIEEKLPIRDGGRIVNVNHHAVCRDVATVSAQQLRHQVANLL